MRKEAFPMTNPAEVYERQQYSEAHAILKLRIELEKGVENAKSRPLYTIEEAWREIDAI